MRHRREVEESSLELLLDTMCNTFGGVMFIAISIFVIIYGMTQIESAAQSQPDPTELRREIESIQMVIDELENQIKLQTDALELNKKTDLNSHLREILMLENMLQSMRLKSSAETVRQQTLKQEKERLLTLLQQSAKQQIQLNGELQRLKLHTGQLEQDLTGLQHQQARQPEMIFKVIESSEQAPFFIILHGDSAFPVGPWIDDDGNIRNDDSVAVTFGSGDKKHIANCMIKPDCGIKVLDQNTLSNDFQDLLARIPAGRVPKFHITPGSARTAHFMREILKNRSINHGCSLSPDNTGTFVYQYTQNAEYEY